MPTAQLAVATAALAHAEAAGSAQGAAAETAQARDKLRQARVAVADREPVLALRLAQQAQLDALLAESLTETAKARQSVLDTQAASRALQEEMARQRP
jgi:UDP-N-acetylmuramyl pentapeptide synthase